MRGRRINIALITFIIFLICPLLQQLSFALLNESIYSGPYLERITVIIIPDDDQQISALKDGEIDLISNILDPTDLESLPDEINVANVLRNGYGALIFNCDKYPFNISAFRRAAAFAIDKNEICEDVWDGYAIPLDSLVPASNPLSIEGQAPVSYHDADLETAESLLDNVGFIDVNEDGFREYPNGSELEIRIDFASSSYIATEISSLFEETFHGIGINATAFPYDYYVYPQDYSTYFRNFDIIFSGRSFKSFSLDWMVDPNPQPGPMFNFSANWSNSTYDAWANQLMKSTSYDDVAEAAENMQKIWLEECPQIICYENILLDAYRTDTFTEFVNDALKGVKGFWTNFKVRLENNADGQFGGNLKWAISVTPDTFNVMTSTSEYTERIFELLYDTLLKDDPEGIPIPWLAPDYTIQTSEDDNAIPEGHSRLTFSILSNATWSDGEPMTAEDIRYCLTYYRDTPGNPLGTDLQGLTVAYTPTDYQIVLEFNTTSYWHLYSVGYKPILPKHVLETIGLEGWSEWDPDPLAASFVTSGPFQITDFIYDEYIELTFNPTYFYKISSTQTNDPGTGVLPDALSPFQIPILLVIGFATVVIVLVVCGRNRMKTS